MLSVTCTCCGHTATDDGATTTTPFPTWNITVATADVPEAPESPAPDVMPAPRSPARVQIPAAYVQLCLNCRTLLVAGNFAGLAKRGPTITSTG